MARHVFSDFDEMLDPSALTAILGTPVLNVSREEISTEGFSDNVLYRVTCTSPNGDDTYLVAKQFDQNDWIAALTSDTDIREISLFEAGWYRQLPSECQAPMLAVTRGNSGSSILMHDVSNALFPAGDDQISEDALETCLSGIGALHASNWGGRTPPAVLRFCSTEASLGLLSPEVGRRRVELGVANDITSSLEMGWEKFADAASSLAARTVAAIQHDPSSILEALTSGPQTLVHGDLKFANLGIDPLRRLVMLDWALVGSMSPFIDIGWFLAVNSARLPVSKDTILEAYRVILLGRGIDLGTEWVRHAELGLLAGGVLRLGWVKALGTLTEDEDVRVRETNEFGWWCELTERASRWLG